MLEINNKDTLFSVLNGEVKNVLIVLKSGKVKSRATGTPDKVTVGSGAMEE
jgi:hypothetical protein